MIHRPGRARLPFRRAPLRHDPDKTAELPDEAELINTMERTTADCAEVRRILSKTANFPPEIIDIVMDLAEYWVCSLASLDFSVTKKGEFSSYGGGERENRLLIRTEPLGINTWHPDNRDRWQLAAPARKLDKEYSPEELQSFVEGPVSSLEHPVRKIVFDIVGRDQGWSHQVESHHTYRDSWTWFNAGIDRFDKAHKYSEDGDNSEPEAFASPIRAPTTAAMRPVWPLLKESLTEYDHGLLPTPDHMIQCNRVAEHAWQHHHVEWSWKDNIDPKSDEAYQLGKDGRGPATADGSFLRHLRLGDMVTVWEHARFPGWVNSVQKVEVRVYWAL
ncbi:hypothetical protein F4803DRAFT_529051 [Xylaria telfairii]|nr:hypothetical protein F4803DRAFT_529051 [Xylaria telfairii]